MKCKNLTVVVGFLALIQASMCELQDETNPKNDQGLPVIFLHGVGSSCHDVMEGAAFKAMRDESPYKNPVYCIEYGYMVNSLLKSMTYLTQKACREFERYETKYNLKGGFIIFGDSQGAMIGRSII